MARIDIDCSRVAGRNHGVISRERARELGLSSSQIRYRVSTGAWAEICPGQFFVGGGSPTWESMLAAAVASVGPESAAAGRSAAAHFSIEGCRKGPIEVVTTAQITRAPFKCRRTNLLPRHHVCIQKGIRTTKPARFLFDLSAVLLPDDFYPIATDVLRKKLATLNDLKRVHQELAACGRNGTRALADFLALYDPQLALTANRFEEQIYTLLDDAGLPLPTPQGPVLDSSGQVVRYDFVYRKLRIVIEADGFSYHFDPKAKARDERRRNRLILDGWIVLVFSWEQLMFRPHEILEDINEAIARRS